MMKAGRHIPPSGHLLKKKDSGKASYMMNGKLCCRTIKISFDICPIRIPIENRNKTGRIPGAFAKGNPDSFNIFRRHII
jgi:hypothetical protein